MPDVNRPLRERILLLLGIPRVGVAAAPGEDERRSFGRTDHDSGRPRPVAAPCNPAYLEVVEVIRYEADELVADRRSVKREYGLKIGARRRAVVPHADDDH